MYRPPPGSIPNMFPPGPPMPPFARPPFGGPPPPPGMYGAPFMPMRPPMMMPPPRPDADHLYNKLQAFGLDNKVTTVWVGKISPVVEDETVKRLLESCGSVNSWARVEANGQQKSFGFCFFANAEGALRAFRLLDNLLVGDENLKLKVDGKTETYLQLYDVKRKEFEVKEKAECDSTGRPFPTILPWTDRDDRDTRAKDTIERLIEPINRALSGSGEGEGVVSREIRNYRERQAKMEKEKRLREEELDRKRKEREEEEKKQEEKRKERLEKKFKDNEKDWIEHEKVRDTERRRILQDMRERTLKRKKDLLLDDEDDKARRRKIRSKENRRRRMREKEEDENERIHEQEVDAVLQKEDRKRLVEEEKRKLVEDAKKFQLEKAEEWQLGQNETAKKNETSVGSFETIQPQDGEEEKPGFIPRQVKTDVTKSRVSVSLSGQKRLASAVGFSAEEPEEENPVVANIITTNKKVRLATLDVEIAKKAKEEAARAEAKNVINQIPTDQPALFEYKINWDLIDAKKLIDDKLRPWVSKKITEYLGEEEPTLIEYVCKKLHEHSPPQDIIAQLQHVLEEEASTFVIKMWRMLIYVMLMS